MPLYDITNYPRTVTTRNAFSYDVLQKAVAELGKIRFEKDCEIVDYAISEAVQQANDANRLVFAKTGMLFGQTSTVCNVKDYMHIWASAEMVFRTVGLSGRQLEQSEEMHRKLVGGLVRYRMTIREENWLVFREESGLFNKYTGEEIRVSKYWVNENFKIKK